jgi:hypothetical protein
VKTLRRKLEAMVAQLHSADFGRRLARRWVEAGIIATRYLYVDGHMKSYSGKRPVQQFYSSKRRLAMPGVHAYFVGDKDGRPLLYLNEQLSAHLAKAMPDIVTAIRQVLGNRNFRSSSTAEASITSCSCGSTPSASGSSPTRGASRIYPTVPFRAGRPASRGGVSASTWLRTERG